MRTSPSKFQTHSDQYLTPKQLMLRWRCSRSGVSLIADHAGLARQHDGKGARRNSVSYLLTDVVAYEQSRRFRPQDN